MGPSQAIPLAGTMAIKVESIAFLLALVGCTLISTVAVSATENNPADSTKTEIETLRNNIKKVKNEPKRVEEMLKNYERPDDKIGDNTVGDLVELCRESLDKCFNDKLIHITSVTDQYLLSLPNIERYGYHCKKKMANFCLENIETVTENLLNSVTEEEKEIAKPFWESVRSSGLMERAHENAIALGVCSRDFHEIVGWTRIQIHLEFKEKLERERENLHSALLEAFLEYQEEKYGTNPSAGDLELFFFNFLSSMKKYYSIYHLYDETQKRDQSAPDLKDETAIDLFKFGRIAGMFYLEVSGMYFEALAYRMTREYGCTYNLSSYTFKTQTEEEFLERRKALERMKTLNSRLRNFVKKRDCFQFKTL